MKSRQTVDMTTNSIKNAQIQHFCQFHFNYM